MDLTMSKILKIHCINQSFAQKSRPTPVIFFSEEDYLQEVLNY